MILCSHPTGNANVRQAALALAEAGLLDEFWTCVGWNPDSPINRMIPEGWRQQLNRRALPPMLRGRTRLRPWHEMARHLCQKGGLSSLTRHEQGIFSVDGVYRALDRAVAHAVRKARNLSAVYAYEDGAAATFAAARERGWHRFYDLPIGYWRVWQALLAEEKEREPEWAATLQGAGDSPEKLARKDEELRLATRIYVASTFTRDTLKMAPVITAPVEVIPYGSPALAEEPAGAAAEGPLRVLFVGALSQRKGLSYLLKAVSMLGRHVQLTIVGTKPAVRCPVLDEALARHRWIASLPHAGILQEMRRQDVFVFPSLFEGFGLVILEAMAQALVVITTPHTAGPELITDGESGYVVPIRSAEAIAARLEMLASDRALLRAMKQAAWIAAGRRTWAAYRRKLAASVRSATAPVPCPEVAA